ncbi:MAG: Maf family protein [Thermoflavifilum sp.]|nr:Maf family protein [Thermoflavifilum sp.]
MGFILASSSPRRIDLLQQVGYLFKVMPAHIEENFPETLAVEEIPVFLARKKAQAVKERITNQIPILAADTIVILNGEMIGKPQSVKEATVTLQRLSGKMHRVITGVVLIHESQIISFAEETKVWFKPLSARQIEYYVSKYQPFDKAGSYAIQEWIGLIGVCRIEGDYFNVMGLPIHRVVDALQSVGIFPAAEVTSTKGSST